MLLIVALLWGGSFSVQSMMSNSLGNYTIVFLKTVGSIFLIIVCIILKRKINRKTILLGLLVGATNGTGLILQQIGISTTTVSKASFISGLYVVFVPILGLFTKKKPKTRFWWAVIVAFFGLNLLCMNGEEMIGFGDLITLVASIFFALQIILIDKYADEVDPLPFCAFQQLITACMSGILMMLLEKPHLSDFNGLLLPIIYMMMFSGLLAQVLQNKYQKLVEPTVASLIMSLESVFGAIGGWLLLNQTITLKEGFGCVLLFIAILIAE